MVIAFDLRSWARGGLLALGSVGFAVLVLLTASQYVVANLSDERSITNEQALLRATSYLPNSALLQSRISEEKITTNLTEAEVHASRAVTLSPHNYKFRLVLALVKEKQGDLRAAEVVVREAVRLAPNHTNARLKLARLLLEQGRLTESIAEFHRATMLDNSALPASLDLIWRASRNDVSSVEAITSDDPHARLMLADFLLKQNRAAEATRVFGEIKDTNLLDSSEGATFINSLMTAGQVNLAHDLWLRLVGSRDSSLIWNGSLEQDLFRNFVHFDWRIEPSEYARISIDTNTGHTGGRSLRIDFRGRDTTILNSEIQQLLVLEPGTRYRFQGYEKTEALVTTQGPRIVFVKVEAAITLGASTPIAEGTHDWQLLTFDFQTPQAGSGAVVPVLISIKRQPSFSYDDPTRGTVWFDDFTLEKLADKR